MPSAGTPIIGGAPTSPPPANQSGVPGGNNAGATTAPVAGGNIPGTNMPAPKA